MSINPPDLRQVETFVRRKFDGVLDKGGKPYAEHCIRVCERLPAWCGPDEWHAALLHDVLEDTETTVSELWAFGFTDRTIWLVEQLTRPKSDGRPYYRDYIRKIAATGDNGLIAIKLSDNADNSDPERIAQLPEGERGILTRYQKARQILEAALTLPQRPAAPDRPVRSSDFPFTVSKECPRCGHRTPNLPSPPFYCLHCDATWGEQNPIPPNPSKEPPWKR